MGDDNLLTPDGLFTPQAPFAVFDEIADTVSKLFYNEQGTLCKLVGKKLETKNTQWRTIDAPRLLRALNHLGNDFHGYSLSATARRIDFLTRIRRARGTLESATAGIVEYDASWRAKLKIELQRQFSKDANYTGSEEEVEAMLKNFDNSLSNNNAENQANTRKRNREENTLAAALLAADQQRQSEERRHDADRVRREEERRHDDEKEERRRSDDRDREERRRKEEREDNRRAIELQQQQQQQMMMLLMNMNMMRETRMFPDAPPPLPPAAPVPLPVPPRSTTGNNLRR